MPVHHRRRDMPGRWRRAYHRLAAAAGVALLTACGPPSTGAEGLQTPTPAATTPHPGDGFSLESPTSYCRSWLQALRPVHHDQLNYVASSGLWDGTAPAFGGLEACRIRIRDVPAAAAANLDFVEAKLTISDDRAGRAVAPALPSPATVTDWEVYLQHDSHTPLFGELSCDAIWNSTDEYVTEEDLADCDLGPEGGGQMFSYEFSAVHRGVFLAAEIDYYTTDDLPEEIADRARTHAMDLYARFATEVAGVLPPP